jgi:hypothetical protein
MSNSTRYIDLDSTFRDRSRFPNPADFEVMVYANRLQDGFHAIDGITTQATLYPSYENLPLSFYQDPLNTNIYARYNLPYMYSSPLYASETILQLDALAIAPTDNDAVETILNKPTSNTELYYPLGRANDFYTGCVLENVTTGEFRNIVRFTYLPEPSILEKSFISSINSSGDKTSIQLLRAFRASSNVNRFYVGKQVVLTSGANKGRTSLITDSYTDALGLVTLVLNEDFGFEIQPGTSFNIVNLESWFVEIDEPFATYPTYPSYGYPLPLGGNAVAPPLQNIIDAGVVVTSVATIQLRNNADVNLNSFAIVYTTMTGVYYLYSTIDPVTFEVYWDPSAVVTLSSVTGPDFILSNQTPHIILLEDYANSPDRVPALVWMQSSSFTTNIDLYYIQASNTTGSAWHAAVLLDQFPYDYTTDSLISATSRLNIVLQSSISTYWPAEDIMPMVIFSNPVVAGSLTSEEFEISWIYAYELAAGAYVWQTASSAIDTVTDPMLGYILRAGEYRLPNALFPVGDFAPLFSPFVLFKSMDTAQPTLLNRPVWRNSKIDNTTAPYTVGDAPAYIHWVEAAGLLPSAAVFTIDNVMVADVEILGTDGDAAILVIPEVYPYAFPICIFVDDTVISLYQTVRGITPYGSAFGPAIPVPTFLPDPLYPLGTEMYPLIAEDPTYGTITTSVGISFHTPFSTNSGFSTDSTGYFWQGFLPIETTFGVTAFSTYAGGNKVFAGAYVTNGQNVGIIVGLNEDLVLGQQYRIRENRQFLGTATGDQLIGGSTRTFQLPPAALTPPIDISGNYIWVYSGLPDLTNDRYLVDSNFEMVNDYRFITEYDTSTGIGQVSVPFSADLGQLIANNNNLVWNVLSFASDSVHSLDVVQDRYKNSYSSCYAVSLISLILPNVTLLSGNGNRIAFYPFVYVALNSITNPTTRGPSAIYSNNPYAVKALFKVPINNVVNPTTASFVSLTGMNMVQTVKFSPMDSFAFTVILPNGEVFETAPDSIAPIPPISSLQVFATFGFVKL